ncbi:MAG: hypothetical protein HY290_07375 [Planctomycetia bacterium]|nr:hypothetical protein [Planctomycetia bacterium]
MTSPLHRKRPITRRNTLRSICGNLLTRFGAGLSIIAVAALPGWTAESASPQSPRAAAATAEAAPGKAFTSPRRKSAKAHANPAAEKPLTTAATQFAAPHRKSSRVTPVNFQPDLAPVPDRGPDLAIRPFRKIADIVPYDNYEPDPELAAKDQCNNLCPRPQGGDCPDCAKDGEGNLIPCPECPWEQELRRIGRAPGEPDRPFVPRDFAHIHYCWEPTNLYHIPIYFEDVTLERYGHTRCYLIQPLFSLAKFAVQLGGLPYQMSLYPVWEKQYSLGYYRPGEFVPYKYHQIPLNAKAAVVEAGVISGAYFLFAPGVGP